MAKGTIPDFGLRARSWQRSRGTTPPPKTRPKVCIVCIGNWLFFGVLVQPPPCAFWHLVASLASVPKGPPFIINAPPPQFFPSCETALFAYLHINLIAITPPCRPQHIGASSVRTCTRRQPSTCRYRPERGLVFLRLSLVAPGLTAPLCA